MVMSKNDGKWLSIHNKDKLCKSKISMKLPANLFSIIGIGSFNSTLKAIIPLTDVYVV